jgi:hypothetical protein
LPLAECDCEHPEPEVDPQHIPVDGIEDHLERGHDPEKDQDGGSPKGDIQDLDLPVQDQRKADDKDSECDHLLGGHGITSMRNSNFSDLISIRHRSLSSQVMIEQAGFLYSLLPPAAGTDQHRFEPGIPATVEYLPFGIDKEIPADRAISEFFRIHTCLFDLTRSPGNRLAGSITLNRRWVPAAWT